MEQYPALDLAQTSPYPQGEKISVIVDKDKFVHTRNALTNAFVGLSGAIDVAVKAYVAHTNAVLEEGSTLDISYLMQPLTNINNVAQIAQQVLQNGNGAVPIPGNVWPNGQVPQGFNADGTKKKRQYKPRDPNAPKRPLTAYFRYLQEMRPKIAAEVQARGPPADGNKAGDISKIATERWNSLPANEQAPYRAAYKKEMVNYDEAVKQYKAIGGEVGDGDEDAAAEDDDEVPSPPAGPVTVKAGADEEEDDDDEESSDDSDESSEVESDEEPAKPLPPPPVVKKTPKPKKATAKAGADPVVPTPQTFSSLNGFAPVAEMSAPSSSPTRKRKAEATPGESEKKKKGKKSNAEKIAAEAVATPSSQLVPESSEKPKKEKKEKKKRKSEAAA
ncbi:hypothetical protein DOTSEDRAFT_70060 [Dothistroma septosporum NZE10]|uniref:HMG box domain-containing protein n=1 Tax=Dothistroma septosporum (strain NZE10 / CBS 128990) TaxID=675120 RepID=N1PSK2_DOTSN|nr:hypothetical protein DOTSEDRAFT_70060 [Dothistroma septosporum NZE10]